MLNNIKKCMLKVRNVLVFLEVRMIIPYLCTQFQK